MTSRNGAEIKPAVVPLPFGVLAQVKRRMQANKILVHKEIARVVVVAQITTIGPNLDAAVKRGGLRWDVHIVFKERIGRNGPTGRVVHHLNVRIPILTGRGNVRGEQHGMRVERRT